MPVSGFWGRIFTDETLDADDTRDPSFRFTDKDHLALGKTLNGVPIRFEHEESIENVGQVVRHYRRGKNTYVVASMKNNTPLSRFALKSISGEDPLYTGLSLGHVARMDLKNKTCLGKRPVEVSICRFPRRPGCQIMHVCNSAASEKNNYIRGAQPHLQHSMSNSSDSPESVDAQANHEPTPAALVPSQVQNASGGSNVNKQRLETTKAHADTEQLMSAMLEMDTENNHLKKELEELRAAQQIVRASQEKDKRDEEERQQQKIALLVEAWMEDMKSAGAVPDNQDVASTWKNLATTDPLNAAQVLQVMQCASKKHKDETHSLRQQIQSLQSKHLEDRYSSMMSKRKRDPAPSTVAKVLNAPIRSKSVSAGLRKAPRHLRQANTSSLSQNLRTFMESQSGTVAGDWAKMYNARKKRRLRSDADLF